MRGRSRRVASLDAKIMERKVFEEVKPLELGKADYVCWSGLLECQEPTSYSQ